MGKRKPDFKAAVSDVANAIDDLGGNTSAGRKGANTGMPQRQNGNRNGRQSSRGQGGYLNTGPKSPRSSGTAFDLVSDLGRVSVPAAPTPRTYTLASGRTASTDIYQDRVFSGRPSVWMVRNQFPTWQVGTAVFMQSGVPNTDLPVSGTLGPVLNNTYGAIVRLYEAKTGRVIRDTTLDNSGSTINVSIADWLNQYTLAFLILRGLQGALNAGDFNRVATAISNSVNQSLFRLEADLRTLATFSAPPKLIQYLDALCGVKALDADSPLIYAGMNTNIPVLDLTNNANVQTELATAENALANLQTGAATRASTNDLQRISNLFALVYGEPSIGKSKPISYDAAEWTMQVFQEAIFRDTTAVKLFAWPNVNATSTNAQVIPIPVPKGYNGPALSQMMSLLRTYVASVDPVAGITSTAQQANGLGLIGNSSLGAASMNGVYSQNGTFTAIEEFHAGIFTYGAINAEADMSPFISIAGLEPTDYNVDQRQWHDYDLVYLTKDMLIDETAWLIEDMFLDSLKV